VVVINGKKPCQQKQQWCSTHTSLTTTMTLQTTHHCLNVGKRGDRERNRQRRPATADEAAASRTKKKMPGKMRRKNKPRQHTNSL